jgi:hypothetical protein
MRPADADSARSDVGYVDETPIIGIYNFISAVHAQQIKERM